MILSARCGEGLVCGQWYKMVICCRSDICSGFCLVKLREE